MGYDSKAIAAWGVELDPASGPWQDLPDSGDYDPIENLRGWIEEHPEWIQHEGRALDVQEYGNILPTGDEVIVYASSDSVGPGEATRIEDVDHRDRQSIGRFLKAAGLDPRRAGLLLWCDRR